MTPSAARQRLAHQNVESSEALAGFLRRHAGLDFCHGCLAGRLGLPLEEIRAATGRLRSIAGFRLETGVCAECGRARRVIQATTRLLGAQALVTDFLTQHPGLGFCDACLAFENGLSLVQVAEARAHIERLSEVGRAFGECTRCGRLTHVARRQV